jgi:hypothetical protein
VALALELTHSALAKVDPTDTARNARMPVALRASRLGDAGPATLREARAVQPPVTCLAISMSRSQAGDDTPTAVVVTS